MTDEAGEITIDEALINANVIGRMRKTASEGYPLTWLEDVRISTNWFKLSDYDSYFD